MEEQRCSLQPSRSPDATPTHNGSALNSLTTDADAEAFFKSITSSQGQRLDDQRAAFPTLPEISGNSKRKEDGRIANAGISTSPPHIIVAEGTPKTSRKDYTRRTSQPQIFNSEYGFSRALPKSASFTTATAYQKKINSPGQVTVKVSMSFTPELGHKNTDQPSIFPEVFLTLGAPGDNLVIPLSPSLGRSLSFNLNLVPKEDVKSRRGSQSLASPRRGHSRSSSPNPHEQRSSSISPDEDCFSLIEKVHTAQLQKGGKKSSQGDPEKGRGKKDNKYGGNKH
ncbi:uncharacterized protein LOC115011763 [Cottoperca gobio]|uniref:Uncharacterized protein LOC115011763 n=1 Tax=Cottoperca gobio TaxID=56716 RepID=A0A6J2Q302_COTGO|nr:uncharacterized protein LOC115011763 [Cottoperca gobio]